MYERGFVGLDCVCGLESDCGLEWVRVDICFVFVLEWVCGFVG